MARASRHLARFDAPGDRAGGFVGLERGLRTALILLADVAGCEMASAAFRDAAKKTALDALEPPFVTTRDAERARGEGRESAEADASESSPSWIPSTRTRRAACARWSRAKAKARARARARARRKTKTKTAAAAAANASRASRAADALAPLASPTLGSAGARVRGVSRRRAVRREARGAAPAALAEIPPWPRRSSAPLRRCLRRARARGRRGDRAASPPSPPPPPRRSPLPPPPRARSPPRRFSSPGARTPGARRRGRAAEALGLEPDADAGADADADAYARCIAPAGVPETSSDENGGFVSAGGSAAGGSYASLYAGSIGRGGRSDGVLPPPPGAEHTQFSCDACDASPILGHRWHCATCVDYDLCDRCFRRGVPAHDPTHRMLAYECGVAAGGSLSFSSPGGFTRERLAPGRREPLAGGLASVARAEASTSESPPLRATLRPPTRERKPRAVRWRRIGRAPVHPKTPPSRRRDRRRDPASIAPSSRRGDWRSSRRSRARTTARWASTAASPSVRRTLSCSGAWRRRPSTPRRCVKPRGAPPRTRRRRRGRRSSPTRRKISGDPAQALPGSGRGRGERRRRARSSSFASRSSPPRGATTFPTTRLARRDRRRPGPTGPTTLLFSPLRWRAIWSPSSSAFAARAARIPPARAPRRSRGGATRRRRRRRTRVRVGERAVGFVGCRALRLARGSRVRRAALARAAVWPDEARRDARRVRGSAGRGDARRRPRRRARRRANRKAFGRGVRATVRAAEDDSGDGAARNGTLGRSLAVAQGARGDSRRRRARKLPDASPRATRVTPRRGVARGVPRGARRRQDADACDRVRRATMPRVLDARSSTARRTPRRSPSSPPSAPSRRRRRRGPAGGAYTSPRGPPRSSPSRASRGGRRNRRRSTAWRRSRRRWGATATRRVAKTTTRTTSPRSSERRPPRAVPRRGRHL